MPGDAGFDPFCLAKAMASANARVHACARWRMLSRVDRVTPQDLATFKWMQEAELKHARVAMLATVLWPLSELEYSALKLPFLDLSGRWS